MSFFQNLNLKLFKFYANLYAPFNAACRFESRFTLLALKNFFKNYIFVKKLLFIDNLIKDKLSNKEKQNNACEDLLIKMPIKVQNIDLPEFLCEYLILDQTKQHIPETLLCEDIINIQKQHGIKTSELLCENLLTTLKSNLLIGQNSNSNKMMCEDILIKKNLIK